MYNLPSECRSFIALEVPSIKRKKLYERVFRRLTEYAHEVLGETREDFTFNCFTEFTNFDGTPYGGVQIDPRTLENFMSWRKEQGDTEVTLWETVSCLRTFFRWLYAERKLEYDPAATLRGWRMPVSIRRDYLSDISEAQRFLDAARDILSELDALMIEIYLRTGLRNSEVRLLKIKNLDFHRNQVYLEKTKRGRPRWVAVPEDIMQRLEALISKRVGTSEWVFPSHFDPDRAMADWEVNRELIKKAAMKAGINKNITAHALRHSFVALGLRAGIKLSVIQHAVDHKTPSITVRVYGHIEKAAELKSVVDDSPLTLIVKGFWESRLGTRVPSEHAKAPVTNT